MNKIRLSDQITIHKGNFSFVYDGFDSDNTGKEAVYRCCLEAESKLKTNYADALSKFRILFETMGYESEVRQRCADTGMSYTDARKLVDEEIENHKFDNKNDKTPTAKNMMIWEQVRLLEDEQKQDRMIRIIDAGFQEFSIKETSNAGNKNRLGKLMRTIYGICSEPHHSSYAGGKDNAEKVARIMYDLLSVGCDNPVGGFSMAKCPVDEYFPVPLGILDDLGISNRTVNLYVKEKPSIQFFIFKPAFGEMETQYKRDLEVLDALWNKALYAPNNIVYMKNEIGTEDYRMQILSLPSRPETLDRAIIHLSGVEKQRVIKDIIVSIQTLHHMTPQVTHRALCPLDFFVCITPLGIKTILYQFDYAKQWTPDDEYTVMGRLNDITDQSIRAKFLDTKLLMAGINEKNACKADVYSAGELIKYILGDQIDAQTLKYVGLMTGDEFALRPSIDDVYNFLFGKGTRLISYSIRSLCNPRRKKTEDAFISRGCDDLCGDTYSYYDVAVTPYYSGVFDGLGGAYYGDAISGLVAQKAKDYLDQCTYSDNESIILSGLIKGLQQMSLEYMENEDLDYAGTTVALSIIDKNKLYVANIGDSRAYIIDENGMTLLTKDHRYSKSINKKGELYQYIGMDESDGTLSPFIEEYDYWDRGYVLLCTDGLTDYVDESKIKEIVLKNGSLDEKTKELIDASFGNGLQDDVTVILMKKGV